MRRIWAVMIVVFIFGGVFIGGMLASQSAMFEERSLSHFGEFPKRQFKENYQQALYDYFIQENKDKDTAREMVNLILDNRPDLREPENLRSIGIHILENAPKSIGAANVVTGVLWDFRGYDTIGEATVIFVAVTGITALFRASKKEEEEE